MINNLFYTQMKDIFISMPEDKILDSENSVTKSFKVWYLCVCMRRVRGEYKRFFFGVLWQNV